MPPGAMGGGGGGAEIPPQLLEALIQALQAEGAGPQGMEVAASMLKKAKAQTAQRAKLQQVKRANQNKMVTAFRAMIQQVKQADAKQTPAAVV